MIRKIISVINIDKNVSIFLSGRLFSYISYPLTLALIINFLNPVEQGYYYTFLTKRNHEDNHASINHHVDNNGNIYNGVLYYYDVYTQRLVYSYASVSIIYRWAYLV